MAFVLGGCAAPGPFVHHPGEFNRAAKDYGKEPTNIDSVTICYNKYGTSPGIVAKMASAECARFNKTAEYRRQSFEICPLFTPVAAEYECIGGPKTEKKDKIN
ncbi:MAG TPA: hypothetical protein VGA19_05525 [Rhodospirillales bacterium]